jgi:hypothetical protein
MSRGAADVFLNGHELQHISRDLRLLDSVLRSGVLMQRAHQLADVAGDMTRSHFPDDRSAGGGGHDSDPDDRTRAFLSSRQRRADASALKELERGVQAAVSSLRGALVLSDRAVRGGQITSDAGEVCASCGKTAVLVNAVHCMECDAGYRQRMSHA